MGARIKPRTNPVRGFFMGCLHCGKMSPWAYKTLGPKTPLGLGPKTLESSPCIIYPSRWRIESMNSKNLFVALPSIFVLIGLSPAFGQVPRVPKKVIRTDVSAELKTYIGKRASREMARQRVASRKASFRANTNRATHVRTHTESAQRYLNAARQAAHPSIYGSTVDYAAALDYAQNALNEALLAKFSEEQLTPYKEMVKDLSQDISAQAVAKLERAHQVKDPMEAWDSASSALELAKTANLSPVHLILYEDMLQKTQKVLAEKFLKKAQKWIEEKPFLSLAYAEFAQSLAQEAGCSAEELAAYEEILQKAQEETDIIEIEDALAQRHEAEVSLAKRTEKEVNAAEREILKQEADQRQAAAAEQRRNQYNKVSDLRDQWRNASTKDRPAIAREWQKQAQILEEQYASRSSEILTQQANEAVAISGSEIKAQQRAQKFADRAAQMIEELNQMQARYDAMPALGEKDAQFTQYIEEAKQLQKRIQQRMNATHPTVEEFAEVEEYAYQLKYNLEQAKIIYQEKISFAEKIAEQKHLEGEGAEEAAAGAEKAMAGKQFRSVEQYVNELLKYYDELDLTQP